MIPTCPTFESDGKTLSPLVGQAVIANLYAGFYEVQAYPAADRIARGEQWLQTNTLDGGAPHEVFIKPNEPGYFQEFGPGDFHVTIGFANPKIINDRKDKYCASALNNLGPCTHTLKVQVTNNHMSRTPDQRTFSSGSYDHYSFTHVLRIDRPARRRGLRVRSLRSATAPSPSTTCRMARSRSRCSTSGTTSCSTAWSARSTINGDTTKECPGHAVAQRPIDAHLRRHQPGRRAPRRRAGPRAGQHQHPLPRRQYRLLQQHRPGRLRGLQRSVPVHELAGGRDHLDALQARAVHTVYDAGGAVDGTTGGGGSDIAATFGAIRIERPNATCPTLCGLPGARAIARTRTACAESIS